jgi:hypothetical protein
MDMAPTPRPTVNRPPMTVHQQLIFMGKAEWDIHMGSSVDAVMIAAPRRKNTQLSNRHFCRPM